jgi:D-alanyl-lipoteichoic acid acyltransferase DltB (MBOAT superfamily)
MKTADNIKKVALIFFLVLGLGHIISGLMFSNNFFLPASLITNRVLDIPFAMAALIYGLSSIYTEMGEKKHTAINIIFILISLLVFGLLLYINLLVPDKPGL